MPALTQDNVLLWLHGRRLGLVGDGSFSASSGLMVDTQLVGSKRGPVVCGFAAGNNGVGNVYDATLHLRAHRSVGSAVQQNPVQVEAGSPDCVVAVPRAIGAEAISLQTRGSRQHCHEQMPRRGRGIMGTQVLSIRNVFERTLDHTIARVAVPAVR